MGKILFWIVALIIGAAVIAALIVWLAPLLAAIVVLYVTSKVIIYQNVSRVPRKAGDISIRPVDSQNH